MLDHVALYVRDLAAAKAFYAQALAPLGYRVVVDEHEDVGFATPGEAPDFWLCEREDTSAPTHVAFKTDRPTVHAVYEAALAAGGRDNGAPGLRAHYHEHFYAAFVLDPEGNNIEAVCQQPA